MENEEKTLTLQDRHTHTQNYTETHAERHEYVLSPLLSALSLLFYLHNIGYCIQIHKYKAKKHFPLIMGIYFL